MTRTRFGVLGISAVLWVSCNANTGGKLITLPFEIGGVDRPAAGPLFFDAPSGAGPWQVELDQALMAAGPFYFNIQPPETSTLQSGVVIMQVTQQFAVDALDPTLQWVDGGAAGETGPALSAEVDLFPACGSSAAYSLQVEDTNPAACFANPNLQLLQSYAGCCGSFDFGNNPSVYAAALISGVATCPSGWVCGPSCVPSGGCCTSADCPVGASCQALQCITAGGGPTSNIGDAPDSGPVVVPFQGAIAIDLTRANQGQPAADLQRTAVGCNLSFTDTPSALVVRVDPTLWFAGVSFGELVPAPRPCPDAGLLPDGGAVDAGVCVPVVPPGPYTWEPGSNFNSALYEQGIKNQGILLPDGGYSGVYQFSVVPNG